MSWVWAILIVLILRQFFVSPFVIPSESMKPTLKIHDRLLANKIIYKIRKPHRWEVVIFRYPENPKQYFVKRMTGLPGEEILIRNGKVVVDGTPQTAPVLDLRMHHRTLLHCDMFINGVPQPPPAYLTAQHPTSLYYYGNEDITCFYSDGSIGDYSSQGTEYGTIRPVRVPENAYFVLGDNSINSRDSRYWGMVPQKNLVAKALFIFWPPWRMGFIH